MLAFGLPEVLLPAVRAVQTESELQQLVPHLPGEAAEALLWLADGLAPDEVLEVMTASSAPSREVDTRDLETALSHPDSRRRFATVDSQQDLASMLNAPLEKWRIFLHPSQERLARWDVNGPVRVLGGAGTGKTVVAMHRVRYLASEVYADKTDRILFTTFTGNLAQNIERNLRELCGSEMERVEVVHLHAWAVRFMRTQGVQYSIVNSQQQNECWEEAIAVSNVDGWDAGFLRQEWEEVVQANGIRTKEEYLRVHRLGRGRTLSRPDRARVWSVFDEYREALENRGMVEWVDVIRETRRYLEQQNQILPYRAVVVDEAQDLHVEEWRLIRALVPDGPNDLFIVGDAHQRIYGRKVVLGRCGINIRGRSRKLRINYRTTEEIRDWAVALLEGVSVDDLDDGSDDQQGYHSLLKGVVPEVHGFGRLEQEREFLGPLVTQLTQEYAPEEICLVARTRDQLTRDYLPVLEEQEVVHVVLDQEAAEGEEGVRLATMHRVKGLEFPCMVLAGVSADRLPLRVRWLAGDATSQEEHVARERALLFVAATRARDRLVVTYWGEGSPFLSFA